MKRIHIFSILIASAFALFSCGKSEFVDNEVPEKNGPKLVPLNLSASVIETRTEISGKVISFSANDKINVFDDTEYYSIYDPFVTTNGGATAEFEGQVDESATDFYALYPYNEAAQSSWAYNSKTATTILPSVQSTDFGSNNINAGIVTDSGLSFYNVCCILKITIPQALDNEIGMLQITLDGQKLTGNVAVDYSGSIPTLTVIEDDSASSSVSLEGSDASLPAGTYYLSVAPVNGTNIPVTVYAIDKNADKEFTLETVFSKSLPAGTIKNLGTLPDDVFENVPVDETYTLVVGNDAAKWNGNGNQTYNDVTWTLNQDSNFCQIDGGVMHMGSASTSCTSASLSTSGITGKIKSVTIHDTRAYSSATVSVKVGDVSFKCNNQTSVTYKDNSEFTFTGEGEGVITISWTNKSRALYFGNIDVVHEGGAVPPVNVTYFVGNTRNNARVAAGTELASILPESPSCGIEGYEFRGWSENVVSTTDTEPAYTNITTVPNTGIVLYAVFAKKTITEGDLVTQTLSTSFSDPDGSWTVSDSDGTQYWKIFKDDYINSPEFDLSKLKSIDVQMGTYGGGSSSLKIASNDGTTWATKKPSTNSENTSYSITSTATLSGTGFLVFTANGATTSTGLRIKSITIKYDKPSEIITYSGYTTSPVE